MDDNFLSDVLRSLEEQSFGGYGYVKEFIDVLGKYQKQLGVGAACAVWHLSHHEKTFEYSYFMNGQKISLDSLNLEAIMNADGLLDSNGMDFSAYKRSLELGLTHIVSIPLHCPVNNEQMFQLSAAVIIISAGKLNIERSTLYLLYSLMSSKRPVTLTSPVVMDSLSLLAGESIEINRLSLKHRHYTLNRTLEILSSKGISTNTEPGLRHFSFWSVDSMGMAYVSKEFNKNTLCDDRHSDTNSILEGGEHYVYKYVQWLKTNGASISIEDAIWLMDFGEIHGCIRNEDYFKKINITSGDSSILVFPIFFESYISVCCLYIKDIIFTPYISKSLIRTLSDSIKQRITLVNECTIRNMLSSMMDKVSVARSHLYLYQEVEKILKETHEAKDCLIYLKNDYDDRYVLVTTEDDNDMSSYEQPNMEEGNFCLSFPDKYMGDTKFMSRLRDAFKKNGQSFIYENDSSKVIQTACMTPIIDTKGDYYGFVILLNKKHEIASKGTYFHQAFFYNNIYVTKACSQFLILYRHLEFSISRKNMLLKKYRHEMPTCIDVINTNIRIIRERYIEPVFRIKELAKLADEILLYNERIDQYATLFSAIDFKDYELLEKPTEFNLQEFMRNNMDSFKKEAAWRGVTLRYNIGIDTPTQYVSLFYQFSVTNLITNAIRYALPGTCIWVRSDSDGIEVSDMGIPVLEKERYSIFKEGYRGQHARRTDQKGVGFGLYFTKRIIELHKQNVFVECRKVDDSNYFAQYVVYQAIKNMDHKRADAFIYNKVVAGDIAQAGRLFIKIQSALTHIPRELREYLNNDEDSIDIWIDYKEKYGPSFFVMEKNIFSEPIYKVSFKIEF